MASKKKGKNKPAKPKYRLPVAGPFSYDVYEKKGLKYDGGGACGLTTYADKKIEIDSGMTMGAQYLTAWHEWFHAFLMENGYNAMASNESFIECLAQCVSRVAPEICGYYELRRRV